MSVKGVFGGGMRRVVVVFVAAVAACIAFAIPAFADVRADKTVEVSHNLDLVATSGYDVGQTVTVEVFRNGVKIGEAEGPAAALEGVGLEVNHGPLGAPAPGDCWDNITPDILPGDEVRVTGDGGTDSVIVPGINFAEGAAGGPTLIETDDPARNLVAGDIIYEGTAFDAEGNSIVSQVELEMRRGAAFRRNADEIRDLGNGGWRAIHHAPYNTDRNRDGLDEAGRRAALLDPGSEHTLVYIPSLQEAYTADLGAGGGPGPGCEGSPSEANAITATDDDFVNINSGDLLLSGTALEGATAVEGTLTSFGGGSTTFSGTATLSDNGGGEETWTATIPRSALDTLLDGTLTTNTTYTVPDGAGTSEIGGKELTIVKDTLAPVLTADPVAGTYTSARQVALLSDGGEAIRYSTDGNPPNNNSRVYDGQRFPVSASTTVRAFSTDAAGNRTDASFAYVIEAVANTAPETSGLRPAQGASTKVRKPLIGATVVDDQSLAKSNIRLFVDGRRVTNFTFASNRVSYRTPRLAFGRHSVRVVATDSQGLVETTNWNFRVIR